MTSYRKLSFPEEFILAIEKHLVDHPELGYTSVPDYLKSWGRIGVRQESRLASWHEEAPTEDDPPPSI